MSAANSSRSSRCRRPDTGGTEPPYTPALPDMSARHDLFKTYDEWRDWTVREGEAIRCGDWNRVHS